MLSKNTKLVIKPYLSAQAFCQFWVKTMLVHCCSPWNRLFLPVIYLYFFNFRHVWSNFHKLVSLPLTSGRGLNFARASRRAECLGPLTFKMFPPPMSDGSKLQSWRTSSWITSQHQQQLLLGRRLDTKRDCYTIRKWSPSCQVWAKSFRWLQSQCVLQRRTRQGKSFHYQSCRKGSSKRTLE